MKRDFRFQRFQPVIYRIMLILACMLMVLIYNNTMS